MMSWTLPRTFTFHEAGAEGIGRAFIDQPERGEARRCTVVDVEVPKKGG